ncbi:hypothetical protein DS745_09790 [Anaerobacillus alkaliphilus]|uniref:Cell wall protein n=1 Tax=Anaerobacillus alkaliphilus TaxID=1548597 RepID=A0A4Q0VTZ9_9BACI|nr:hypothetical protein [Anaerobacillus alkaliphilus]RXJ01759.1 hypothetical protein DS745_09790 [Anaerobacillus alkaliphilus]
MKLKLFLLLCIIIFPIKTFAETGVPAQEPNFHVSPADLLFDLNNIKPGDIASRTLAVSNHGVESFNYVAIHKFTGGSKKFYEELLLKIEDNQSTLYEGKLNEFKRLPARPLESSDIEDLFFQIEVPFHLGNDFQGLTSQFTFTVVAEEDLLLHNQLIDLANTNKYSLMELGFGGLILIWMNKRNRRRKSVQ